MRKVMVLFLAFFFSEVALSEVMKVKGAGFSYEAVLSEEKISIKANLLHIDLTEKECNKSLMTHILKEHEKMLQHKVLSRRRVLVLTYQGQTLSIEPTSKLGSYLRGFPVMLQKAKRQEKLLCSNK